MIDWSGTRIRRDTRIYGKRFVLGAEDVSITMDIREWLMSSGSETVRRALGEIKGLPTDKEAGSFDRRARLIWQYVIGKVQYFEDDTWQKKADFWQFPAETLSLGKGDCEDCACVLAALLLAAEISPFCVRVVLGHLKQNNTSVGHAWPIYRDEDGIWRILESTLKEEPVQMPAADRMAEKESSPRYVPAFCFNQFHLWQITDRPIKSVPGYVKRLADEDRKELVVALR